MSDADPGRPGTWDDLGRRTISALVLGGLGLLAVWQGGVIFALFVAVLVAVIFWEMGIMFGGHALRVALVGGATVLSFYVLPFLGGLVVAALALALVALCLPVAARRSIVIPAALVLAAAAAILYFRETYGAGWMIWLGLVVVVSDVAAYFAGRKIGGPKFAPRISPKKTWSGTGAGWLGAAVVGVLFTWLLPGPPRLIWLSVVVAFAGQMGDILESALKRRHGVKDSGGIMPGHGGLYDRFDSMIGAALAVAALSAAGMIQPGDAS
ncbi:MAG: phosphatidate cytidylyltransferase [Pseudomonadota bacterium]